MRFSILLSDRPRSPLVPEMASFVSWYELGRVGERAFGFRADERLVSAALPLSSLSDPDWLREKFRRFFSTTERRSFERRMPLVVVTLSTVGVPPVPLMNTVVLGVEGLSSSSSSSSVKRRRKLKSKTHRCSLPLSTILLSFERFPVGGIGAVDLLRTNRSH